jgi:hypothetical protein
MIKYLVLLFHPNKHKVGVLIALIQIFFSYKISSQEMVQKPVYSWSGKTEVGLNMTNLIARFIPLNFGVSDNQDVAFKYRKYRRTSAFKLDLGARVTGDLLDGNRQFIFLALGVEKRRNIWEEKWTYVSSFDFNFTADPAGSIVGIARTYGIEYSIFPNIFLSAQASLIIGVGTENGLGISLSPPKGIFLNVRF